MSAQPASWLRDHALTIVLLSLFAFSFIGQAFAGFAAENDERLHHGAVALSAVAYLTGGAFLSSVFENWESEFLQMWAYVMLTAYLFQRGSPESKNPDETTPQDRDPALDKKRKDAPWPVRAGGLVRAVYAHSLGLALLGLFIISFALHFVNSGRAMIEDARLHHLPSPTIGDTVSNPEFWFESFQNWQSEFLSTAVLIVLGIYLRERGSPESKPVAAPNRQTGAD